MRRFSTLAFLAFGLALVVGAWGQADGEPNSPEPSPEAMAADPMFEVRTALVASGIRIVNARETSSSDTTFTCLSGSIRSFAFDEEAPHPTFRPGEKPPIDVLAFATLVERQAAQRRISGDGTHLNGSHGSAMIDGAATPDWSGAGRYLLLVVSNDGGLAAQVAAAAAQLGHP